MKDLQQKLEEANAELARLKEGKKESNMNPYEAEAEHILAVAEATYKNSENFRTLSGADAWHSKAPSQDTRPLSVRMQEASGYGLTNRFVAEVEALEHQVLTDRALIKHLERLNDVLDDDNDLITQVNNELTDDNAALLETVAALKDRVEALTDQLDTAAGLLGIA